MNAESRLQDAFRKLTSQPSLLQPAIVKSVDTSHKTCEIELVASGMRVLRARLQALVGEVQTHFFVQPAVGSYVLVAQMAEEWIILLTSDIETLLVSASAPVTVIVGEESLGTLLSELIEAVKALQVPTPAGLSGTPFTASQTTLGQLITRLKKILTTN